MARVVRAEGEERWSDGRACTAGRGEGGRTGDRSRRAAPGSDVGAAPAARERIEGGAGSCVSVRVATAAVSSCFSCVFVLGCEVRCQGRGWAE